MDKHSNTTKHAFWDVPGLLWHYSSRIIILPIRHPCSNSTNCVHVINHCFFAFMLFIALVCSLLWAHQKATFKGKFRELKTKHTCVNSCSCYSNTCWLLSYQKWLLWVHSSRWTICWCLKYSWLNYCTGVQNSHWACKIWLADDACGCRCMCGKKQLTVIDATNDIMITKGFYNGLAVSVSFVGWAESGRAYSLNGKDGCLENKLLTLVLKYLGEML